jgi:hypothetical protein
MSGVAEAWQSLPLVVDVVDGIDEASRATLAAAGAVLTRLVREDDDAVIAPRWRFPITGEERGIEAIALPVDLAGHLAPDAAVIADLVALPLDGSRPQSFTGLTTHVGELDARDGRMIVYGSGRAWLSAWLAQVRAQWAENARLFAAAASPSDKASAPDWLHRIDPPHATLVLAFSALEWRTAHFDCVIPRAAREIVCPDSRALAELIDSAMRKKVNTRPFPTVRGPSAKAPAKANGERAAA